MSGAFALKGAPELVLSPTVGSPTTRVVATGSGFGSAETIDLAFDEQGVAVTTTRSDGRFRAAFRVCSDTPPGPHTVTATGNSSGAIARATFTVRTDWKQEAFDSAHTGVNPYENVLSISNVSQLVPMWVVDKPVEVMGSPLMVDGVVYTGGWIRGTSATDLYALDAETGATLWRTRQANADAITGVAAAGGRVFLSTVSDHNLRAFAAATGRHLWALHLDGAVGGPTLARGLVYVQTNAGSVYAVRPDTGEIAWRRDYNGDLAHSPALADGVVYVAGGVTGQVRALDAADGHLLWRTRLRDQPFSSPAVAGGMVYVSATEAGLYAIDAATGEVVWRRVTGSGTESMPAIDNNNVYVGDVDGVLHAFDRTTGNPLWTSVTPFRYVLASPVVANGVIYTATHGFFALDPETGDRLWACPTDVVNTTPAVANGVVYLGDFKGKVYAFHLPSG